MSKRTKKYLLVSLITVMMGVGVIVGCVSQRSYIAQSDRVAVGPKINPTPSVEWQGQQDSTHIVKAYNTFFKVPESYSLSSERGRNDTMPLSISLTMPDLKPLSETKRDCRSTTQVTNECLRDTATIYFGHDFNKKTLEVKDLSEINYLNYFKKDPNGVIGSLKWNYYLPPEKPLYGFDKSYYLDLEAVKKSNIYINNRIFLERDSFFKYDQQGNVITHVRCMARDIQEGVIVHDGYSELILPTCEHMYLVKKYKMGLNLTYDRRYLSQWQQMQDAVTHLIEQFHEAALIKRKGGK